MGMFSVDRTLPESIALGLFTDRTDLRVLPRPGGTWAMSEIDVRRLDVKLLDGMRPIGPVGSRYDRAPAIVAARASLTADGYQLLDIGALAALLQRPASIPTDDWQAYADSEWAEAAGRVLRADGTQLVAPDGAVFVPALDFTRGHWSGYLLPDDQVYEAEFPQTYTSADYTLAYGSSSAPK